MRILLVSLVSNNQWSGMGKWTYRMLTGLNQLGHQASAWFLDDFDNLNWTGRFFLLIAPLVLTWRLWRNRKQFDAVIVHEPSAFWYGLLRKLMPALPPLIVMCHNVESKYFLELVGAAQVGLAEMPLGRQLRTRLFRLWQTNGSIRLADQVVCLSNYDRRYLIERLGCAAQKITCQINGVDNNFFSARRINKIDRVLFVGGWLDVKGCRLLPALWQQVLANYPEARLTLLGTGQPTEVVVNSFAASTQATITVIPRITAENEVVAQYAQHDLFLLPSISEGSPLSLLEAMSAGLPVVAARVGGVPDIVTDQVDGLLFNPLDAAAGAQQVCRLFADQQLAARLAQAGQLRAQALNWQSSAQQLFSAVDQAIKKLSQSR